MRYEDAIARLASLPAALPPWSPALRPIRVAAVGRAWDGAGGGDDRGSHGEARPASVLVLITPGEDGEALVILTERAKVSGDRHSGEISFPGGGAEPEDADPVATALREAAEEVGLDPVAAGVRVVGMLDTFDLAVSGFSVTPVLAIADRRPNLTPAPREVARILEAPVRHFLPGAAIEYHERSEGAWTLRYGAYRVEETVIWGATARILSQLGGLLRG
jgi:8-oxo-dGTP pyrophosphatase MutT (NUDIX family)